MGSDEQGGEPAIWLQALTKEYRHRRVLNEVTLRVEPGSVFGFLGANGAGKTTTIDRGSGDVLR